MQCSRLLSKTSAAKNRTWTIILRFPFVAIPVMDFKAILKLFDTVFLERIFFLANTSLYESFMRNHEFIEIYMSVKYILYDVFWYFM